MSLSNQTATELLRETARRGCHFVLQGDGPECAVEWPHDEAGMLELWCQSCFSRYVLIKAKKSGDCQHCYGTMCFGKDDPPSLRCTR